jgi:hypothetical protein
VMNSTGLTFTEHLICLDVLFQTCFLICYHIDRLRTFQIFRYSLWV